MKQLLLSLLLTSAVGALPRQTFRVELPPGAPTTGRVLIFASEQPTAPGEVDANLAQQHPVSVAGQELKGNHRVLLVDADRESYPQPFSRLKPGRYFVQAVLDGDGSYNYTGRAPGDWVSPMSSVRLGVGSQPTLRLQRQLIRRPHVWRVPSDTPASIRRSLPEAQAHAHQEKFNSQALSSFWKRPTLLRSWVLTPPNYEKQPNQRFPVCFFTHGFTGNFRSMSLQMATVWQGMASGKMPPMIWVFLDESCFSGTHEFADSVNNGPWGEALVKEYIPWLDSSYRTDGTAQGRFFTGHSSGGWAALWLQVTYPKVFGGVWASSPDPSDFHDFMGVDLYRQPASMYRMPDGRPLPLIRMDGRDVVTMKQFVQQDRALGAYGQMASFEWVFSPAGPGGRPLPLFDRSSGRIDPAVARYWIDHYDIARRLQRDWPTLEPDLRGKLHVIVGTADTFGLDAPAHRLQQVLRALGDPADVRFLPGRTHFDLFARGGNRLALLQDLAWEMYDVARPAFR